MIFISVHSKMLLRAKTQKKRQCKDMFSSFTQFTKNFSSLSAREPPLVCEFASTKPVQYNFLGHSLVKKNLYLFFRKTYFVNNVKQSNLLFTHSVDNLKDFSNITWVSSHDRILTTYINFLAKRHHHRIINNYLVQSKRWLPGLLTNFRAITRVRYLQMSNLFLLLKNVLSIKNKKEAINHFPTIPNDILTPQASSFLFSFANSAIAKELNLLNKPQINQIPLWAKIHNKWNWFQKPQATIFPFSYHNEKLQIWHFNFFDQLCKKKQTRLLTRNVQVNFLLYQQQQRFKKRHLSYFMFFGYFKKIDSRIFYTPTFKKKLRSNYKSKIGLENSIINKKKIVIERKKNKIKKSLLIQRTKFKHVLAKKIVFQKVDQRKKKWYTSAVAKLVSLKLASIAAENFKKKKNIKITWSKPLLGRENHGLKYKPRWVLRRRLRNAKKQKKKNKNKKLKGYRTFKYFNKCKTKQLIKKKKRRLILRKVCFVNFVPGEKKKKLIRKEVKKNFRHFSTNVKSVFPKDDSFNSLVTYNWWKKQYLHALDQKNHAVKQKQRKFYFQKFHKKIKRTFFKVFSRWKERRRQENMNLSVRVRNQRRAVKSLFYELGYLSWRRLKPWQRKIFIRKKKKERHFRTKIHRKLIKFKSTRRKLLWKKKILKWKKLTMLWTQRIKKQSHRYRFNPRLKKKWETKMQLNFEKYKKAVLSKKSLRKTLTRFDTKKFSYLEFLKWFRSQKKIAKKNNKIFVSEFKKFNHSMYKGWVPIEFRGNCISTINPSQPSVTRAFKLSKKNGQKLQSSYYLSVKTHPWFSKFSLSKYFKVSFFSHPLGLIRHSYRRYLRALKKKALLTGSSVLNLSRHWKHGFSNYQQIRENGIIKSHYLYNISKNQGLKRASTSIRLLLGNQIFSLLQVRSLKKPTLFFSKEIGQIESSPSFHFSKAMIAHAGFKKLQKNLFESLDSDVTTPVYGFKAFLKKRATLLFFYNVLGFIKQIRDQKKSTTYQKVKRRFWAWCFFSGHLVNKTLFKNVKPTFRKAEILKLKKSSQYIPRIRNKKRYMILDYKRKRPYRYGWRAIRLQAVAKVNWTRPIKRDLFFSYTKNFFNSLMEQTAKTFYRQEKNKMFLREVKQRQVARQLILRRLFQIQRKTLFRKRRNKLNIMRYVNFFRRNKLRRRKHGKKSLWIDKLFGNNKDIKDNFFFSYRALLKIYRNKLARAKKRRKKYSFKKMSKKLWVLKLGSADNNENSLFSKKKRNLYERRVQLQMYRQYIRFRVIKRTSIMKHTTEQKQASNSYNQLRLKQGITKKRFFALLLLAQKLRSNSISSILKQQKKTWPWWKKKKYAKKLRWITVKFAKPQQKKLHILKRTKVVEIYRLKKKKNGIDFYRAFLLRNLNRKPRKSINLKGMNFEFLRNPWKTACSFSANVNGSKRDVWKQYLNYIMPERKKLHKIRWYFRRCRFRTVKRLMKGSIKPVLTGRLLLKQRKKKNKNIRLKKKIKWTKKKIIHKFWRIKPKKKLFQSFFHHLRLKVKRRRARKIKWIMEFMRMPRERRQPFMNACDVYVRNKCQEQMKKNKFFGKNRSRKQRYARKEHIRSTRRIREKRKLSFNRKKKRKFETAKRFYYVWVNYRKKYKLINFWLYRNTYCQKFLICSRKTIMRDARQSVKKNFILSNEQINLNFFNYRLRAIQFLQRLKKQLIQKNKKKKIKLFKVKKFLLLIRVTLVLNNTFVLVEQYDWATNTRKIIFSTSAGRIGFVNSRKRLFTTSWLVGKKIGAFLRQLKDFNICFKCLTVKNARLKNFRIRGFLRGLKDYAIKLNSIKVQKRFPYNGCKKRLLGRTGRKQIFYFQ